MRPQVNMSLDIFVKSKIKAEFNVLMFVGAWW
jgi:hypothetical protein